jgi:hypothetical protein
LGEAAVNASRQVWLASLGAAVVTRDWVQTEAGSTFKALVREGSVVESQAVRFVGNRLETSISMANTVWKETRRTVESTVKQAADVAGQLRAASAAAHAARVRAPDAAEAPQDGCPQSEAAKRAVEDGGQVRTKDEARGQVRDEARLIG